jgi:nucleoside-diphosphate-sugar epimerase
MFVSILKSRRIAQAVVDKFALTARYRARFPEDAIRRLQDLTQIVVTKEGVIVVRIEDTDPKVAAEMANFYVDQLDRLVARFNTGEAGRQRGFVTEQLARAKGDLGAAEEALRSFQERNRAVVLQEQTKGAIDVAARLKGEIMAAEVQLQVLRNFATDANPDIVVISRRIDQMKRQQPACRIVSVVGDILDVARLEEVVREHAPDLVYHAAAYKHVPLMEEHPLDAITNNVFGTESVLTASLNGGVKKLVLISTDKAVTPISVMGMTKRMAECLLQAGGGGPTTLLAVRFGNILGSDGSVLPLFQWQIARGGPVTVTHPETTRYFMLLSEAAQLVLQAGTIGQGGEIFFLDMGEPIRILDLAHDLLRLSGLHPGEDVPIELIGLRPGERLTEELVMDREELGATDHPKVFTVRSPVLDAEAFWSDLEKLRRLVAARDAKDAVEQLRSMSARY